MAKGIIYLICSQLIFVISGYILHAVLGRWLAPGLYGIFGMINSFIAITEGIFLGAISKGVSKFIAQNKRSSRSIINYALKAQAIISVALFIIFFSFAQHIARIFNDSSLTQYVRIFSFLIPLSGLCYIYEFALNGVRFFAKQAVTLIIFSIIKVVTVLYLVYMGYAVQGAIWGLIIASAIRLFVSRHFCRRLIANADINMKEMIRFAIQFVVISSTSILLLNIDLIALILILKEDLQTGLYVCAMTLAKFPIFIIGPLSIALFPSIAKSIAINDKALTCNYINRTLRYVLWFTMPITTLVSATSGKFITLIYSETYLAAASSLSILILGFAFQSIVMVSRTVILAGRRPYIAVYIGIFLVFLDICLNLILIPKRGIYGAALATTLTNLTGCILTAGYVYWRYRTLITPISVFRILLASLVSYVIASILPVNGIFLLLSYFGLILIFFLVLLVTREINSEDIKLVRNLILGISVWKKKITQ